MDFFENRCGSNYICFFSGCILCKEDHETETGSKGSAGWDSDTAAGASADGCGILPAVCVWGETAGWSVFSGVFQRKDHIFLGSYGAGGGGHVLSADVPVGQRRL